MSAPLTRQGRQPQAAPLLTRLDIGLVNNMPDAALNAAERQFRGLLSAAAGDFDIRLHLFHIPGVERGELALSQLRGRYADVGRLPAAGLDAVIVTGAEPRADDLCEEPYWPAFARLVEWVAAAGTPSLWSCLAAHAAVLAMDGVGRHRLESKRTGVFAWERVGDEPALAGLPLRGATPHSRYNDLREDELLAKGYRILTRSPHGGVDLFARRRAGLMLFLQGHPEYDADSLLREYKRDLGRWMRGAQAPPPVPQAYFPRRLERALRLVGRAGRGSTQRARAAALEGSLERFTPTLAWRSEAVAIFASFLRMVAAEKRTRRPDRASVLALRA
ncbi:MAG TPA: homoserine O-succinyltransferase [Caulobacteraceae bacterium]